MDTAQAYVWRHQNFVLGEHILNPCPENPTPVKVFVVAFLVAIPLVPKHLSHSAYCLCFLCTLCSSLYSLYSQYRNATEQPELVIVYFGGNDYLLPHPSGLGQRVPLQEYIENMRKIGGVKNNLQVNPPQSLLLGPMMIRCRYMHVYDQTLNATIKRAFSYQEEIVRVAQNHFRQLFLDDGEWRPWDMPNMFPVLEVWNNSTIWTILQSFTINVEGLVEVVFNMMHMLSTSKNIELVNVL
ncbi:hypothetical protein JHK82_040198 [Glycine max]|nr:hypothetical protein JHK82_040198 [Glycine max]KAG5122266.1 hypothetical protein JHK84_040606 [Glycine max]